MSHQARIGIYAGAFDPVHAGHIAFALQAMQTAGLDRVYFVPERRPRAKEGVEHFAHRVAMLRRAIRPHRRFGVIELVDISLSVERTLPKLEQQFAGSQLVFLFGSDTIRELPYWPRVNRLLAGSELVIGAQGDDTIDGLKTLLASWSDQPKAVKILESYAPDVSSDAVREGLRRRQTPRGLLASVLHYSNRHWLYISLG